MEMRKFRFKFEAVSRVRTQKEQEALRLVGEAQRLLNAEIGRKDALSSSLQNSLSRRESLGSVPVTSLAFKLEDDFIVGTKHRMLQADHAIQRARRHVERAMYGFLLARRDRKVVDRLREKAKAEYKREQSRREQRDLDDLYTMRARLREEEVA